MTDSEMTAEEARESLELERIIRAEAKRCAQAIKLLGPGAELRFVPDGLSGAAMLACFLLELENQCGAVGMGARIQFCLYPCEPPQLVKHPADAEPSTAAIH